MNEIYLQEFGKQLSKIEAEVKNNSQILSSKTPIDILNIIDNTKKLIKGIELLNLEINKINNRLQESRKKINYFDKIIDFDIYDYYEWVVNHFFALLILNSTSIFLLQSKEMTNIIHIIAGINTLSYFSTPLITMNNYRKRTSQIKKEKLSINNDKLIEIRNLLIQYKNTCYRIYKLEVETLYNIIDSITDEQELKYYKKLIETSLADDYNTLYKKKIKQKNNTIDN